jgi:hypothetical protein
MTTRPWLDGRRRRTRGMTRLRRLGGRRRRIRGMPSPRWMGGLPTIPGLAGRPRKVPGSGSPRWLAGRRPSTRDSAGPRRPIPVSAAPPLPGRVRVAAAGQVRVTSGPLHGVGTAAAIVVPETRALLAARRPGLRPARLGRGRHLAARPAAAPLPREKPRARKPSRPQNASLPAGLGQHQNASLTARLSRREAPKRRAAGYRRGCSRWPVPRPSWWELSLSS